MAAITAIHSPARQEPHQEGNSYQLTTVRSERLLMEQLDYSFSNDIPMARKMPTTSWSPTFKRLRFCGFLALTVSTVPSAAFTVTVPFASSIRALQSSVPALRFRSAVRRAFEERKNRIPRRDSMADC
jgi:hypothetical protein